MASCFKTVSKDEILEVDEAAAPTNTNSGTKFGLGTTIYKCCIFPFVIAIYRV